VAYYERLAREKAEEMRRMMRLSSSRVKGAGQEAGQEAGHGGPMSSVEYLKPVLGADLFLPEYDIMNQVSHQ
jgi:hypothetical protein